MDRAAGLDPREASPVLDLTQVDADMGPMVGGKGANLGALLAAGLPVPDGFCLTTTAYRVAAVGANLGPVLAALEVTSAGTDRGASAGATASLARLAGQARTALEGAPVPATIAEAVRAAYARLGADVPVAVRSSATAEDLPEASFAGQQNTYLNVVGADALLDAVRRCWASLWTERAVAYRSDNGVGHRAVSIAVVVQEMVDAEVSGVLFTANPVTGRRGEAVIDAAPGLGEALVSGAVNPDQFVVDVATGEILRRTLGDKRVEVRAVPGGGTEVRERPAAGGPCLTDAQVLALTALGSRAEEHFGQPQDLEWAIEPGGRILLVQSRPITTLYPLPEPSGNDDGTRVYLCASLMQGLVRPLTPMGLSVFDVLITSNGAARWGTPPLGTYRYAQPGLRLFMDITDSLRNAGGRRMFSTAMTVGDVRAVEVLRYLMDDPRFSVNQKADLHSFARTYRAVPQLSAVPDVARAILRPRAALERSRRAEQELRRALARPEPATAAARLDLVERMISRELMRAVIAQLPPAAAGYVWFGIARWLLGPLARPGELPSVLRGLPNNVTTEMDLELWRSATLIRDDPESAATLRDGDPQDLARRYAEGSLPATAQRALSDFLAAYGHRAVAEIDLGVPRWSEDPAHILNVLANYLRLTDPDQAPDRQFARAAREAGAMAAELARRARARGRLRGALVGYGLRRARESAGLREQPKFDLILFFAALRRQLHRVGEELAAAGRIGAPEDVFFLDLTEARVGLRGGDLRDMVAGRRHTYEREMRRRHIPRILLSDGTDVEAAMAARESATTTAGAPLPPGTLAGAPASAGTVTGTARVILDPSGARLEPGEILVAPSTDPGWTPLFLTAGALVMEMGGAVSHGAVVAREYGIPAVVGVPDATTRIRTGDTVTVDGAAGTVTVGVEEPAPVAGVHP
ncbi:PEP/pyruvate-binding domain-containing protein [Georgenia sp. SYP-B2076]|uniref:PEP/pyruvate-binding domain-containing protein n=1 Tax=Georgenia sp. SYP-B2076 TaxID=2495881 RepID=UPI000F8C8963|nr:PEP/pyruvate-binding domain-containing protein [Georgenia sp. SYP-B2076]